MGLSTNLDDFNLSNNFSIEFSSGSPYSSGGGGAFNNGSQKQILNTSMKLPNTSTMISPGVNLNSYGLNDDLTLKSSNNNNTNITSNTFSQPFSIGSGST